MMEYMACGKPVIASYNSGHKDILTQENSIPLVSMKPIVIKDEDGVEIAVWEEPDIYEVIEKIEWAYQNRDKLRVIGKKAGEDMSKLTWAETAKKFYKVIS